MNFSDLLPLLLVIFSFAAAPQAQAANIFCTLFGIGCAPSNVPLLPPGVLPPVAYNNQELATYAQAHALASYLDSVFPSSVQVIPGDDSIAPGSGSNVGIFVPTFFGTPAPSAIDATGSYYFLQLRFTNGAVIDVGLCEAKFASYPQFPNYVVSQIAGDVGAVANVFSSSAMKPRKRK